MEKVTLMLCLLTATLQADPAAASDSAQELGSRHVFRAPEDYVRAKVASLSLRSSQIDPFGYPQPDYTPEQGASAPITAAEEKVPDAPTETLITMLDQLPINGVFASRGFFLTGERMVYQGQEITLTYDGRAYELLVSQITPQGIVFRESASQRLFLKPPRKQSSVVRRDYDQSEIRNQLQRYSAQQSPIHLTREPIRPR